MAYRDLRHWIQTLEEHGELAKVDAEVDWNLELGAITQEVFDKDGPAVLFRNIKDYKDTVCRKFFTASLSSYSRIALAYGLPQNTPYGKLIEVYRERTRHPIPPIIVDSGPCKENIQHGDQVDIWQFPAPLWHKMDGGRYIGTFDGVVTKDPDTGIINVGLYRRMVHDSRNVGVTIIPGQHIWRHFRRYRELGKPMPIAFANGWDPVLPHISCSPQPYEVCEYDVMGALRQAPVELVRCETVDLLVPASAEIVVEGEVSTDLSSFRMEGPFGEYTGYYTSEAMPKPVINVNCITHRNDPILQGTLEGVPINEDHRVASVNHSALIWEHLNKHMTGVTGVNVDASTAWANVFVQIDNSYLGQVHQVGALIWGMHLSTMVGKNIMVVDTDVDVYDLRRLNWAFAYRVDPKKDLVPYPGWVSPADPVLHPSARTQPVLQPGTRLLIDATKSIENKKSDRWFGLKFAPLAYPDTETWNAVRRRWAEYGIPLTSR